ncbi:hypothetical protein [Mycobacterium paragordonae]|uniref:hypothetical protein n=1 Tax=Mycobacterium paragordonae TaxID=1389713 RepID=UPI00105FB1D4|nr:hypothetical protein [Mycobacterium paragordonae]TDL05446.1 hypothetical protein EUA05_17885 [Mycobacterium paragordonae]
MSQPIAEPAAPEAPQTDPQQSAEPQQPDRGFPESTPIAEMTSEQQAAYWKFHDRRKSDTLKSYGGITPEQARQNAERLQELEREQMTASERAVTEAREQAAREAAEAATKQWAPELAKQVVGQFVTDEDQRASVLAGIDPMRFVKDGKFDTDALIGHLTGLSAAFGGGAGDQPRQWGQSGSQPPASSGRDEGLAEARRRGYIKD